MGFRTGTGILLWKINAICDITNNLVLLNLIQILQTEKTATCNQEKEIKTEKKCKMF